MFGKHIIIVHALRTACRYTCFPRPHFPPAGPVSRLIADSLLDSESAHPHGLFVGRPPRQSPEAAVSESSAGDFKFGRQSRARRRPQMRARTYRPESGPAVPKCGPPSSEGAGGPAETEESRWSPRPSQPLHTPNPRQASRLPPPSVSRTPAAGHCALTRACGLKLQPTRRGSSRGAGFRGSSRARERPEPDKGRRAPAASRALAACLLRVRSVVLDIDSDPPPHTRGTSSAGPLRAES